MNPNLLLLWFAFVSDAIASPSSAFWKQAFVDVQEYYKRYLVN